MTFLAVYGIAALVILGFMAIFWKEYIETSSAFIPWFPGKWR